MSSLSDHKTVLQHQFNLKVSNHNLSSEEVATLEKYGAWMEALMNGRIEPITDKHLSRVIRSRMNSAAFTGNCMDAAAVY